MRFLSYLLMLVLAVGLHALPSANRAKRGFRMGAADRFSHGFGKRTELDAVANALDNDEQFVMTTEELAEVLQANPRLSYIVARTLDHNDDGLISRDELLPKYAQ